MIILKNVVKNYKTKKSTFNALNNVSLTLPDNGLFFVTGNSGAGKSTLLNVIGSIDTIDSGEINIDGINLSKTTKKQINNYRQNFIGFVFQQFNLINELTVYENVIVAADLSNNEYSNIDELLQSLNIYDLKNKKINELSGGEQQRVAIARALIKNPKILLCDEPTGMLDNQNSKLIFELLKKISDKILVLVVTHDVNMAQDYSNNIIQLEKGKIIKTIDVPTKLNIYENINFYQYNYLKRKTIFRLALSWMKTKLKSLINLNILIILIFLVSFLCFSLIQDDDTTVLNSMYENNDKFIPFSKKFLLTRANDEVTHDTGLNDEDLNYLRDNMPFFDGDPIYEFGYAISESASLTRYPVRILNMTFEGWIPPLIASNGYMSYYVSHVYGVAILTNEFIEKYDLELYGNLPQKANEVVLTNYTFDVFKSKGYVRKTNVNINNYDDLIGKYIDLGDDNAEYPSLKVVGILDTKLDCEKYKELLKDGSYTNENMRNIWKFLVNYGLHTLIYGSQSLVDELCLSRLLSQRYCVEAKMPGIMVSIYRNIARTSLNKYETYYVGDENDKNGVVIPYCKSVLSLNNEVVTIMQKKVEQYAHDNYDEIKEQWLADGNEDSLYNYYNYILSNKINKYDKEFSFEYFQTQAMVEYIKSIIKKEITIEIPVDNRNVYNATVKKTGNVIGFCLTDELCKELYLGSELYDYFYKEIVKKGRGTYKYVIDPLTGNRSKDIQKLKFLPQYIYDTNIYPNQGKNTRFYYFNGNASYLQYTFYLKPHITIILNILFVIEIIMLIVLIIMMNYYYNNLINNKIKNIGILYSMGAHSFDVFRIFFYQLILMSLIIFAFSSMLLIIIKTILSKVIFEQNYIIVKFVYIHWPLMLAFLIAFIILGSVTLFLLVKKYDRKSPIKTILTLS